MNHIKPEGIEIITSITLSSKNALNYALLFSNLGADSLHLYDDSTSDTQHEKNIDTIKEVLEIIDIPIVVSGNIKRFEDVKKYFYAGASKVIISLNNSEDITALKESVARFSSKDIFVSISKNFQLTSEIKELFNTNKINNFAISADNLDLLADLDVKNIMINDFSLNDESFLDNKKIKSFIIKENEVLPETLISYKETLINLGYNLVKYTSSLEFSNFKLNSDDLLPVIVQDYKTNQVLMMAYMNEESFNNTISTGLMTYYSRSRNEQWVKGLTSGHYQYVKSLAIDCDKDTLLAKVFQVGVACHTGNDSCFYETILKKEYNDTNPLNVFTDVFNVIKDRKINPKEGSYTNYLFDKGIDKILKKVGEEATEIVIAAKNPNPEEIKYEIADFLYHAMVLMAEKGVSWEDITRELAKR